MAGAKPGVHLLQLRPISVSETLIKGNKFIMFNDNSTTGTPVTMKVDEKGYIMYWRDQNKEMDFLDIALISDTRTGSQVKIPKDQRLRDSLMIGQSDVALEDKMVTVTYGKDMVNIEFVHFVCPNKESAQEWADELLKYAHNLLALNSSSLTYLDKLFARFNLVLNNEGKVSMKNIIKNIASNRDDRKKVEKALEAVGFHAGKTDAINPQKFTFENFFNFYRHLLGRTEVDKIFDELGAKKKPYLTTQQFCDFLNKQQRDPRLNEVLYPNYTLAKADELIHRYETKSGMAQKGHLSQEGFLKYLMSEDNNIIPPDKLDISEDMDQPLAHYFINSSHNTYLTGHQLTGKSSVEIYHQVLLSGCRCVELDCWDGKDSDMEPIITHGYTMCTEVLFKDVIEAIAQSAFKTSDYPVILSFENHCSPKQQAKMANYCRTIFGDLLLINPLDSHPLKQDVPLPSPNLLKRKIIIKNKKKHFHRAQNMSKRVRSKPPSAVINAEGLAKTKLDEVTEDVEMSSTPADTEQPDPPAPSPAPAPTPEPEQKSPSKTALDRNVSINSEGTDTTELAKEGDDGYDSDSDSSDSDDDDDTTIADEGKEKNKKKQKKILTEEEKKRIQRMKKEKGTAGKEASAAMEMSLLVNYIQPVHFHTFEASEKRRRSYEITSFVETQGTSFLKEFPVDFVNYNKRQMSRIYPKGTRVDSSNFMPQVFWNAGCQLVALNFQTLDLAMQFNLGIFEYNGRTGYILKPDFMRRRDRHFDPFAESTVDGIIAGKLSIKIISGQFLSDKKVGTYVEVDMYGLPTDTIRKRFKTKTVLNNGLNPVYDEEPFVFKKVVLPNLATIRIAVYEDQNKTMIGHHILPVEGLRPGYRHIPLRNECNLPLLMPSLFVHIMVKDYIPDKLAAYADALSNPIAYQSNLLEKHSQQLEILTQDFEEEKNTTVQTKASEQDITIITTTVSQVENDQPAVNYTAISVTGPTEQAGTGNKRQNSITTRTPNVSLNPLPNSDNMAGNQSNPSNNQTGSQTHLPVSKQESSQSATSQGSNGSTEVSILSPTPLSDLKTAKQFVKVVARRDKEVETVQRKHEKARDTMEEQHQLALGKLISSQTKSRISMEKHHTKVLKKMAKEGANTDLKQAQLKGELQELLTIQDLKHREMKASHARSMMKLCKEHYQVVLEIKMKHHDQIYDILQKLVEDNQAALAKALEEMHDNEVTELKKRMDLQSREHMKTLGKKHKDKQELSRIKREAQQKHVQTAVTERQKLKEALEKRHSELEAKLDEIKKQVAKEKEETLKAFRNEYDENVQKLEEELGSQLGDDDINEEDASNPSTEPNRSNSTSQIPNGELEKGPHVSTIVVKGPSKEDMSTWVYDGTEPDKEKVSSKEELSTWVYDGTEPDKEKVNSKEELSTWVYDGTEPDKEKVNSKEELSTWVYDGTEPDKEKVNSKEELSTWVYDGTEPDKEKVNSKEELSTWVYDGTEPEKKVNNKEELSTWVYDGTEPDMEKVNSQEQLTTM